MTGPDCAPAIDPKLMEEPGARALRHLDVLAEPIFDDERGHYLLVYTGWNGKRRVHGSAIHVDLRDGKVWVQHDGTKEGIVDELVSAGIPPERIVLGFHHPAQLDLTRPYLPLFFEVIDQIWASRDSEPAQEFVELAYPAQHVSPETVAATDAWLAGTDRPAPLRRLVAEGRDGVVRALKARAKDSAA